MAKTSFCSTEVNVIYDAFDSQSSQFNIINKHRSPIELSWTAKKIDNKTTDNLVVLLTTLDDIHLSTVALWNVTLSVPGTFLTCPLLIMLRIKCYVIKGPY